MSLKEQNPDLKVMIAIGGWTEGVKKYSQMASSKPNRDEFVKSAVEFVQGILTTVILLYSLIFTNKCIGGNTRNLLLQETVINLDGSVS